MAMLAPQNKPLLRVTEPLSQYPLFRCRDIDDACEQVVRTFGPYKLEVLAHNSSLITQFDGIFFKGIALLAINYGATINVAQLDAQKNRFAYATHTILSGRSSLKFGGQSLDSGQGRTLVTSPSEAYHFHLPQGARRLTVMFEERTLHNHLRRLIDLEVDAPICFDLNMPQGSERNRVWLGTLNYLCTQLAQSEQLLSYRAFMQNSADMLMSLLLEMQPNNYSLYIQSDPVVKSPRAIRRAVEYIEDHVGEPVSLVKIAAAVGVSVRVLQKGFRRYLDCTPTDYIRKVRARRVHEDLRNADPEEKISEILYKNGVTSLGHFCRLYRSVYGCTPGDTLKGRH